MSAMDAFCFFHVLLWIADYKQVTEVVMKKSCVVFASFFCCGLVISCGTLGYRLGITPEEELLEQNPKTRPSWVDNIPDGQFVGVSGNAANEQLARDDAVDNAIERIITYQGSFYSTSVEELSAAFGLSSEIIDPTESSLEFQQRLSQGFQKNAKENKYYTQKYRNNKYNETYWKSFVLVSYGEVFEENLREHLDAEIEDLKEKRDAANDEQAKRQFDQAIEMFQQAKNLQVPDVSSMNE